MNEKEIAERLNRDVNHLLDGHSLAEQVEPGEYGEILQIASCLAHNDMSSQSRVRKSLKRSLLGRSPNPNLRQAWSPTQFKGDYTMQSKTRLTLFALTALVILVLAVAATPSARTFAQTVWQKVGPLIIVNELAPTPDVSSEAATPIPGQGFAEYPDPRPSQGSERAAAIDVKASPTPVPFDASLKHLTDQQAHDLYGFQVLQPAYMPNGYQLATHQINRFANGKIVSGLVYLTKSTAFDAPYLGIEQSTYQEQPPYEFMVGDATISQVTVRGITATFIEGAPLMTVRGDTGQNVTLLVDYLMWEENGSFFVINATQLTQQEMIQIAESLQ